MSQRASPRWCSDDSDVQSPDSARQRYDLPRQRGATDTLCGSLARPLCSTHRPPFPMASAATVPAGAAASSSSGADAAPAPAASSPRVGLIGAAAAASLSDLDWRLLRWQRQLKDQLPERPKQTGFRVFSILTYVPEPLGLDEAAAVAANAERYGVSGISAHPYDRHLYIEGTQQQLAYVTGTNTEPCFIGNSICSERSAFLQMRMKRYERFEKLYITADSPSIITPGLLCREMMCEFLTLDTPIVLAAWLPQADQSAHPFDVQVTCLRELYPYPPLLLNIPGSTVQSFSEHFHSTAEKPAMEFAEKADWLKLYRTVVETTEQDKRPGLHPMRYAAGVLFADGSSHCAAMTKLLEYGWSLDPIVKLVSVLEEKRKAGVAPVLVLQADQFGNLHAPSAPARSHLAEYGYRPTLVFHERSGKLVQTTPQVLAPDVPDAIEDVLPTTVTQSVASAHDSCGSGDVAHQH